VSPHSRTAGASSGVWTSPLGARQVASGRLRIVDLQVDGDDAYWIEGRPAEAGRCVIVRHRGGTTTDLIAPPYSARTWVHEYGGAAMRAHRGVVYFSNAADRRLYRIDPGSAPEAITPAIGDVRYADLEVDASRARIVCVVEDHRGSSVVNDIRTIPLGGGEPVSVISGNDFYSTPRVSPDGTRLAWLTWNAPSMPWEGCELWVGTLDGAGRVSDARMVAGGPGESVFQPAWSPDSVLHFMSDRTGWWNLHRVDGETTVALAPVDADCGLPQWSFGLSTFAFCGAAGIVFWASHDGTWRLHRLDTSGACVDVDNRYTAYGGHVGATGSVVTFLAGAGDRPTSVVRLDLSAESERVLRVDSDVDIDEAIRSTPEHITYRGAGGETAHAWYYAPRNDAYTGARGKPPLLVRAHGGPTSATSSALDPSVQYWTSRGFAYLDVDYGGSTGYGRGYRERLNGAAGIVDVGDCVEGARHLAERGDADAERLFIHGGSAGGYVTLCAMTFHDVFSAGASLFGIADLEALLADTHKFEAHYLAPYPTGHALYERSPVHFIDRVRGAVLLLQGLDDPIVPANQAERMFAALQSAGVPCAYIGFPGEQHGFREAANIGRSTEAQLAFFAMVSGTPLEESIEPVPIVNF